MSEKAIQEKNEEIEVRSLQKEVEDKEEDLRKQLRLALEKAAESNESKATQMRKKLDTMTT